jgi:pyridoxine 5-phosphate synthase
MSVFGPDYPFLTILGLSPRIRRTVRTLSVNIDHVATLREARREAFPDPVQAAALVELGGADGVTVHLRQDRRHISDRDVELLRKTVRTELTIEMAGTEEMTRIATRIRPEQVTLVPELATEVTTSGGLDVVRRAAGLAPLVRRLRRAGIRVSMFVEPEQRQIEAAAELGASVVELNTDRYCRERKRRDSVLEPMAFSAMRAKELGLAVHVGHGLDYLNVVPILERDVAEGFSIGFAIVSRAVMVGLRDAVAEMKHILEVYS